MSYVDRIKLGDPRRSQSHVRVFGSSQVLQRGYHAMGEEAPEQQLVDRKTGTVVKSSEPRSLGSNIYNRRVGEPAAPAATTAPSQSRYAVDASGALVDSHYNPRTGTYVGPDGAMDDTVPKTNNNVSPGASVGRKVFGVPYSSPFRDLEAASKGGNKDAGDLLKAATRRKELLGKPTRNQAEDAEIGVISAEWESKLPKLAKANPESAKMWNNAMEGMRRQSTTFASRAPTSETPTGTIKYRLGGHAPVEMTGRDSKGKATFDYQTNISDELASQIRGEQHDQEIDAEIDSAFRMGAGQSVAGSATRSNKGDPASPSALPGTSFYDKFAADISKYTKGVVALGGSVPGAEDTADTLLALRDDLDLQQAFDRRRTL